ncbi:trafficking protein particle complex subunit 1 isoform 1-T1 [Synchiropus picturatus]
MLPESILCIYVVCCKVHGILFCFTIMYSVLHRHHSELLYFGSCGKEAKEMTVHNLYIFDRNGSCLYYNEWNRKKQAGISKDEEFKLMYGMLFSIRSFVSKMSPLDMKDGFLSFQTSKYRLHYYETPSGLKFVMNTDLSVSNARDHLQYIYSNIYVENIVKNPACTLGDSLDSELFSTRLDSFIRGLPYYSPRAA